MHVHRGPFAKPVQQLDAAARGPDQMRTGQVFCGSEFGQMPTGRKTIPLTAQDNRGIAWVIDDSAQALVERVAHRRGHGIVIAG